ncbi:unnamed protein product [Cercospora beticola]|nr:unnamed protein product [Cercospora beticola]
MLKWLSLLNFQGDIWIDALCINQEDSVERSYQVALMAKLYKQANNVLIGLEPPGNGLHALPGCWTTASNIMQGLLAGKHLDQLDLLNKIVPQNTIVSSLTLSSGLHEIQNLIASTWFTRAWTVQEACLARKMTFICEGGTISWDDMSDMFIQYQTHRTRCCAHVVNTLQADLRSWLYQIYSHLEGINYTRRALARGQHISRSLLHYQAMSATDPRDKFFAFRGLHTMSTEQDLPAPDYSKSKEETFTELAIWLMRDQQSLSVLCIHLPDVDKRCPSWVPDWSVRSADTIDPSYQRMRLDFLDMYNAAKGLRMDFDHLSSTKLRLCGAFFDHVDLVAERSFELDSIENNIEVLESWYRLGYPDVRGPIIAFNDDFALIMLAGCIAQPGQCVREAAPDDVFAWKTQVRRMLSEPSAFHHPVMTSHTAAVLKRRLFRTRKGYIGVGPAGMGKESEIWLLGGGTAPFVLQRSTASVGDVPECRLIGHCYVHGVMKGEGVDVSAVQHCVLT